MSTTTRRDVLRLAGGLSAVAMLGACGRSGSKKPTASGELLQVSTKSGLTVLDTAVGKQIVEPVAALATPDRRRLVSAEPDGPRTRITVRDASTAQVVAAASVRGKLTPRALWNDGSLVALVEGEGADLYRPAGRTTTTIVVAGLTGERQRITLPGCVEPEAFSSDGALLFVLDYLPPQQPDHYRVRSLELASGNLSPLWTREKRLVPAGAEEEMRGQGRQAVFDPTKNLLFTLYTHQPDHEHTRDLLNPGARDGKPEVHAFVHTLSVLGGWAYCIDLPDPFGQGPADGHAIARSGSGVQVHVVDAGSGAIAALNPDESSLAVRKVARFDPVTGQSAACFSTDGSRLLLAVGQAVLAFDATTLQVAARWPLPAPARGVVASSSQIYVGQPDAIVALDPVSGAVRRRIPALDLVAALGMVSVE